MKRRTLFVVALVATLLLPGVATAVVNGSPDLSAQLSENRVTPGEDATLGVVILNSGDLDSGSAASPSLNAEVTQARGLTIDMESGDAPVSVQTSKRPVGTLSEGATNELAFNVAVEEDAEPGTYTLPIEAKYKYTSQIAEATGNRNQESTTDDLEVTLEVVEEARFEIVDIDHDAQVGSEGEVELTVQNAGTEAATDATATVTARNAVTTFGESETASRHVGRWAAGANRTLTYDLNTAASGAPANYSFDLSVGFEDADGVDREDGGITFGITPAPEQSFALENPESNLAVGEDGTVTVELVNTADQPVRDLVVEWTGEHATMSVTEREYAVGDVDAGERATATFDVEVSESARSGPRQFSFVANYENTQGDSQTSEALDVRATVGPESDVFDIAVERATVTAGDAGTLEVTITNADDEAVSDVSAKLFADAPVSTTDDEAFVQSLDPGENETLVFGIGAGAGALEKTYPVSLDFRYDETDGDTELSDTYRLPVQVTQPEEGGGLPLVPIVIVLLVIGAGVAYYRYYR